MKFYITKLAQIAPLDFVMGHYQISVVLYCIIKITLMLHTAFVVLPYPFEFPKHSICLQVAYLYLLVTTEHCLLLSVFHYCCELPVRGEIKFIYFKLPSRISPIQ